MHEENFSSLTIPKGPQDCDRCGKTFKNGYLLKNHVQRVHEEKKYKCDRCEKVFGDSGNLQNHIKYVHEGIKEHICDTCGKTFGRPHDLRHHIKCVHLKIKGRICIFLNVHITTKALFSKMVCKGQIDMSKKPVHMVG